MNKTINGDHTLGNIPVAFVVLAATFLFPASSGFAQTNNVFDNSPTVALKHAEAIIVSGEVEKETIVAFSSLTLRSVTVKETVLVDGKPVFRGAYRYDGYSLADILDRVVVKKKNAADFSRLIDLYIEVANDAGEKAAFSWGEIYYPSDPHRILVAAAVSRFIPQLTKDLWPLPAESLLVAGTDFLTVRGIRNPTRITVKSWEIDSTAVGRAASPEPKSPGKMRLEVNGKLVAEFDRFPEKLPILTYPTTLYGQGKGFLGVREMKGVPFTALLAGRLPLSDAALREGLAAIIALDGYRAVFSLSELCNRNDRQECLLMREGGPVEPNEFSLFPAADFFFDRAVSGIVEIDLLLPLFPDLVQNDW